jgi:hypothetical protein
LLSANVPGTENSTDRDKKSWQKVLALSHDPKALGGNPHSGDAICNGAMSMLEFKMFVV